MFNPKDDVFQKQVLLAGLVKIEMGIRFERSALLQMAYGENKLCLKN